MSRSRKAKDWIAKRRRSRKRIGKKNKRKLFVKPSSFLPFSSDFEMSGDCYWKNYCNIVWWRKNYLVYINNGDHKLCSESSSQNSENRPTIKSGTYHKNLEYYDSVNDEESDTLNESDMEFMITEEMMKFMEISMRHKEEMKRKRMEETQPSDPQPSQVFSERDNIEECHAPKDQSLDKQRTDEIEKLYGKSAAMIAGMETALQLTFNRNCDIYKPSFWPVLPLQMKF